MATNARLLSKNGVILNFQVPPKIQISGSATYNEITLFRGKTVQRWSGNKTNQISLKDALWTGSDLRKIIEIIKNSLGENIWSYIQSDRIINNLAITNFNISEEFWIRGLPTRMRASIDLIEVNNPIAATLTPATTKSTSDKLTPKQIKDATKKVLTERKINVTITEAGAISYNSKVIGSVSKAGKITYKSN